MKPFGRQRASALRASGGRMEAKERIIVALDTNDLERAVELVDKLYPYVGLFKIGLELTTSVLANIGACNDAASHYYAEMWRYFLDETRGKLFWDGKFGDIPNTVGKTSRALGPVSPEFFTVHASFGMKAMSEAVKNKGKSKVLAATVLTSLQFEDLWKLGYATRWHDERGKYYTVEWGEQYVRNLVNSMAQRARGEGADGVVCSVQELEILKRNIWFDDFIKVVTAIRLEWAPKDDQKRTATPGEAIRAGADYLVIGRSITEPPAEIGGQIEAIKLITKEIEEEEEVRK